MLPRSFDPRKGITFFPLFFFLFLGFVILSHSADSSEGEMAVRLQDIRSRNATLNYPRPMDN